MSLSANKPTPAVLLEGTGDFIKKTFAKLTYYELLNHGNKSYRHYTIKNGEFVKVFKPRQNLTRLTIKLLDSNGNLYNFGDTTDDGNTTLNCLTLQIVTLQKNFVTNFIDKT